LFDLISSSDEDGADVVTHIKAMRSHALLRSLDAIIMSVSQSKDFMQTGMNFPNMMKFIHPLMQAAGSDGAKVNEMIRAISVVTQREMAKMTSASGEDGASQVRMPFPMPMMSMPPVTLPTDLFGGPSIQQMQAEFAKLPLEEQKKVFDEMQQMVR